jgi:hypothetical protein
VEYLDPTQPQSGNVILGAMFLQSFIGTFTIDPNLSTTITSMALSPKNPNTSYVLPGVYIGNATTNPTAINPFAVQPVTPPISS